MACRPACSTLDSIFKPASVAVVGASEAVGVGRTLMMNLLKSPFGGVVYPVNPKRPAILGVKAYTKLSTCPTPPELVIIAVNAKFVVSVVDECVQVGSKGCIILSAGFAEMGEPGRALERQIMEIATRGHLRIVGPNCLGVMSSQSGLNATFAASMVQKGRVAFFSQSGALCCAVLDISRVSKIGFSAFVSIGSMLDVDWSDLISYYGEDPNTSAIVIYMESIGNAKRFVEACSKITPKKPVIVLKSGRSAAGAKAASSHTGALAGADEVCDAVFERCGVLRVNEIFEAFSIIQLMSSQPRPTGPRLTIITNAGGPGVLTTDALALGGGQLAVLSDEIKATYNTFLPPAWSHSNPVDILGDADAVKYARAVEVAVGFPDSDGVLAILTPQDMTDPTATAQALVKFAHCGKLFMTSFMGGFDVQKGIDILTEAGIPNFEYPDNAVRVFNELHKSAHMVELLKEPTHEIVAQGIDVAAARAKTHAIIDPVLAEGRTLLTEYECKKIFAAYDIPHGRTELAHNADEAVQWAQQIGFPVVMKIHSLTITHKSDVGGVKLNLKTEAEVRVAYQEIVDSVTAKCGADKIQGVVVLPFLTIKDAYETILGANVDPQMGPTILFGMGGILVEVFRDKGLGLAPLNECFAERMLAKTKIYKALQGVRGKAPCNIAMLKNVLLRFSQLIADFPVITEADINPLLVGPSGVFALDARILIQNGKTMDVAKLPQSCVYIQ